MTEEREGPSLGVRSREVSVMKRVSKQMTEERRGLSLGVRSREVSVIERVSKKMTEQRQWPTLGVWFREVSVFQRWPLKKRSLYFCIRSKCSIERDAGKTGRTWVKQQKVTTRGTGLEREISRGLNSHMYVARYNLGQNCWSLLQNTYFLHSSWPKSLPSQNEKPFPPPLF